MRDITRALLHFSFISLEVLVISHLKGVLVISHLAGCDITCRFFPVISHPPPVIALVMKAVMTACYHTQRQGEKGV